MKPHRGVLSVLALSVGVSAAPPLEAQVSGGTDSKQKTAEGGSRSRYGGDVLEMTPDTLDRLSKGLAAEEAARKAAAEKAARTKSPAEYNQCKKSVITGPDGMKLMNDLSAELKKHKDDRTERQKLVADMQRSLDALVEKRCGPNPSQSRSSPSGQARDIVEAAAKDVGLTSRQYAILKERVTPFCAVGEISVGPEGAKIPGSGRVFWVYSAAEVAALRPRCVALMKDLRVEKR